jgi:hypothetical protein
VSKPKTEPIWYDVHFSIHGFIKIQASSADYLLSSQLPAVEDVVCTGLGVEIGDILREENDDGTTAWQE